MAPGRSDRGRDIENVEGGAAGAAAGADARNVACEIKQRGWALTEVKGRVGGGGRIREEG